MGADFDLLSVEVARPTGEVLTVQELALPELSALPVSFNFLSGPTTPVGTSVRVTATATLGGADVSSASGTIELSGGEGARLTLTLRPARRPERLAFVTQPQMVRAGACSAAATVELREKTGGAGTADASVQVSLSGDDGGLVRFFLDPTCDAGATSVDIASGQSSASFHFASLTGLTFDAVASSPGLISAQQTQTILPMVRRGSCAIDGGQSTVRCAIDPPQTDLARTLLVFQASTNDDTPATSNVRCALADAGEVFCQRNGDGGVAEIEWQTAERAFGLNVQSVTYDCNDAATVNVPIQPVSDAGATFLLSSRRQPGNSQGSEDFATVELVGSDTVRLSASASASCQATTQVVELQGANVSRGVTGAMTGLSLAVTGLAPVDLGRTFLLLTFRGVSSGSAICQWMVRGELDSPTSIRFTRGNGNAACAPSRADGGFLGIEAVAWERVELPAPTRVEQVSLSVASGVGFAEAVVAPVDLTRALVLSGTQGASGQGGGESDFTGSDRLGATLGTHRLAAPDTARVTRGSTSGATRWTSFVIELQP